MFPYPFGFLKSGVAEDPAFIIKVKTDNAGTSNNDQFTIPTSGGGYNYDIDWGDSSTDTGQTGNITHTYPADYEYIIKITGTFPGIRFDNGGDKLKLLEIQNWGNHVYTVLESAFYGCTNMDITATDEADFSSIIDWGEGFRNCTSLTTTGLSANWVSSNCTKLDITFYNCTSLVTLDASNWDTSNCTTFYLAFYNCVDLAGAFNVSSWDTGKVTTFNQTFLNCKDITSISVDNWDVSSCDNFAKMFKNCISLTTIPVDNWDTSSGTNFLDMFRDCDNLTTLDLEDWDMSSATTIQAMFYTDTNLTTIGDVDGWDTSSMITMQYAFAQCGKLVINVSSWDTSSNANLNETFNSLSGTGSITGYQNWNVSSVTTFKRIFKACDSSNVATFPSTWDMRGATTLYEMIRDWDVITGSIDCSNMQWDSSLTNMQKWCYSNPGLTDITFGSNNDFSGVTTMQEMFGACTNLTDVTWDAGLDLSALTIATNMFTSVASKMSAANYDIFLIALDAGSGAPGILDTKASQYNAGAGATAHASLLVKGWTINDGGQV